MTDIEQTIKNKALYKEFFDQQSQLDILFDCLDDIDNIRATLDNINPVEIGGMIAVLENKLSKVIDLSTIKRVDSENWEVDIHTATVLELESFTESIGKFLDGLKDRFKSTKTKIKEMSKDAYSWTLDNNEKINYLKRLVKDRSDEVVTTYTYEGMKTLIGRRLNTMLLLKASINDILTFVDNIDSIGASKSAMNNVDKQTLRVISTSHLSDPQDFIKVVRIDKDKLAFIVIGGVAEGVVGFREYVETTIGNANRKNITVPNDLMTLSYARKLIDTANKINELIISKADTFNEEIKNVEASLSGDIENAKHKAGPLFKVTRAEIAFYAMGAGLVTVGGGLVASAIPAGIRVPIKIAGEYVFKAVGFIADKTKKLVANKVGAGLGISSTAGLAMYYKENMIDLKNITFDKLSNREKVRVLTNRIKLTSHTSIGAIYGLDSLVKDMLSVAELIIENHKEKQQ